MELALSSLFDDFPLAMISNGHPRRRTSYPQPIMRRFLDIMEDDVDHKIGSLYRRLPAALQDLIHEYNKRERSSKKRKSDDSTVGYEPKSKVQVLQKDDKFQITLDTSHYQPEEITVKVVEDQLAISAKHESKSEDCYEFHEMYRSFPLPEGVDPDTVISRLDASGQLTVEAPVKAVQDSRNEITVPVVKSNDKPAVENSKSPSKA